MNKIHPAWFRPVPAYWQDLAFRDDERLAPEYRVPGETCNELRFCKVCDGLFLLEGGHGLLRKCCSDECTRANKQVFLREYKAGKRAEAA